MTELMVYFQATTSAVTLIAIAFLAYHAYSYQRKMDERDEKRYMHELFELKYAFHGSIYNVILEVMRDNKITVATLFEYYKNFYKAKYFFPKDERDYFIDFNTQLARFNLLLHKINTIDKDHDDDPQGEALEERQQLSDQRNELKKWIIKQRDKVDAIFERHLTIE